MILLYNSYYFQSTLQGFPGFQWGADNGGGGVQFSMGIGVFPISFFASFFNAGFGERRPDPRKFAAKLIFFSTKVSVNHCTS